MVNSTISDVQVTAILSTNRPKLVAAHPEATHFSAAAQRTVAIGMSWHSTAAEFWKAQGAQLA